MSRLFNKKWKIALIAIVVITLLVFLGFNLFSGSIQTAQAKYVTSTIATGPLTQSVSATGSVGVERQKNTGFKVSGIVSEVDVKVGDTVKAGQQIAKLDPTALQNTLDASKASLKQAQNNFNNRFKTNTNALDSANLQENINTAKIKYSIDQNSLQNYQIKSPQDGKVSQINSTTGDSISGATVVFIITDSSGNNPRNLTFSASGKITEIDVSVGQTISNGQLMAKIDDTQVRSQLSLDQSQINQAQNNYANRYKISTNNLDTDNLQQSVYISQTKVNTDQTNLDNTVLKSDIDGVVTGVGFATGDTVSSSGSSSSSSTTSTSTASGSGSSSSSGITIVDTSSFVVNLTVPESDIAKIKVGQVAQLMFDALGTKQYSGKVKSIDQIGTTSSNVVSFGVKIYIDKPDDTIRPPMSASSTILTNVKDNVLSVPNGAIKTVGGVKQVQILVDNQPQTVDVTTGISSDTQTEILTSLNIGDQVITSTITSSTKSSSSTGGFSLFGAGGATRNTGTTTNTRNTGATGGFTPPPGN